ILTLAALAVALNAYAPSWTGSGRLGPSFSDERRRWLADELSWAVARSAELAIVGWVAIVGASRAGRPALRRGLSGALPLLVMADLLSAHSRDVPTVAPTYWTVPPASVRVLASDPSLVRIAGFPGPMANTPGYASAPVDFSAARDALAWNLAPAWGLRSSLGLTPIYPRRILGYTDHARVGQGRYDVEGVTHFLTGGTAVPGLGPPRRAGSALIYRNPGAQPRARLMGHPAYADDERDAGRVVGTLGAAIRGRVVVEDPDRPLAVDAKVSGTARIVRDEPDRVAVETESKGPSYLVLADTFDPGWRATVDGRPAPIRPAFVAFRAVYLPAGRHRVDFRYRPSGFLTGLTVSMAGLVVAAVLAWPRRSPTHEPPQQDPDLPRSWPWWGLAAVAVILIGSVVGIGPDGRLRIQGRWAGKAGDPHQRGIGREHPDARRGDRPVRRRDRRDVARMRTQKVGHDQQREGPGEPATEGGTSRTRRPDDCDPTHDRKSGRARDGPRQFVGQPPAPLARE
ncbi:MAG: YfhO family protein, partial [Planctomycetia bacterium]|nr:YfhO family protein [Planctomycetia bacterium]